MSSSIPEQNLAILVRNGAFKFTETFFPYTSGEIGPYFIQSIDVTKNGPDYAHAIESMFSTLIANHLISYDADKGKHIFDFDVISGGETRDWDFSNPLAVRLKLPHAKMYGDGRMLGADLKGKRILHVADLNNEGSSIRDKWVPMIRGAGGEITDVLFYVDRMERGVQVVEDLGLRSHAVVPLDQRAWSYLLDKGVVNETVYGNLVERMGDQDAWAKKMLSSDAGLHTLGKLVVGNDRDRGKAQKVIDHYDDILPFDIVERLHEEGYELVAE